MRKRARISHDALRGAVQPPLRKKEHISSVKNFKTEKSALAEHSYILDHRIDWDKASILLQESREQQRKWEEAWEIAKTDGAIANRDRGRVLPDSYIPLLSRYNNISRK